MELNHFMITSTCSENNQEIPADSLTDCGAMGMAIMDRDLLNIIGYNTRVETKEHV